MIFHENTEDHMSAVENYLVDIWNVVVDYDPLGLDEYWIDDGVITINDTRSKQEQLFILLHEAGHVALRKDPDFHLICPGGGTSKIEVLQEEVLAWEQARKIANMLHIPLAEGWNQHVRQAITKYIHWVRI
jgi:Zn-dependent peptidase ImmA (M78 family)